ncbi:MAG: autotransporter-associated beta strand repeat-containing protein [Planctomycetia bacterium]|nr:autotransporter-associated beta strand repeat-containing protein [Planctomycetia bacterium]
MTKTGTGTLVLTKSNKFTGETRVENGTLRLTYQGAPGTLAANSTVTVTGANSVLEGAVSDTLGYAAATVKTLNLENGGTMCVTTGHTTLVAQVNMNNGTLTGTTTDVAGAYVFDTGITITGGTENLLSANKVFFRKSTRSKTNGQINVAENAKFTISSQILGSVSGQSWSLPTINKLGAGELVFAGKDGVQSFVDVLDVDAGKITISNGTLTARKGIDLASGTTLALSGGKLEFGDNLIGSGNFYWKGGTISVATGKKATVGTVIDNSAKTLTKTGAGMLELTKNNTFSGEIRVEDGTLRLTQTRTISKNATITVTGANSILESAATDAVGFADNTTKTVNLLNGGTWNATHSLNAKGGHTTVLATVNMNNGHIIGTNTDQACFVFDSIINVTGGTDNTISADSIFFRKSGRVNNSGHINVAKDAKLTITSQLKDLLSTMSYTTPDYTKLGEGTLVYNTNLGLGKLSSVKLNVTAGTVELNGDNNQLGTLTVAENATLSGTGSTTVETLAMNGTWNEKINSLTDFGTITATNATFTPETVLSLELGDDYLMAGGDVFTILTTTNSIAMSDVTDFNPETYNWESILDDNFQALWDLNYLTSGNGGSLVLSVHDGSVPEPATWVMLLFGVSAIGWKYRQKTRN